MWSVLDNTREMSREKQGFARCVFVNEHWVEIGIQVYQARGGWSECGLQNCVCVVEGRVKDAIGNL